MCNKSRMPIPPQTALRVVVNIKVGDNTHQLVPPAEAPPSSALFASGAAGILSNAAVFLSSATSLDDPWITTAGVFGLTANLTSMTARGLAKALNWTENKIVAATAVQFGCCGSAYIMSHTCSYFEALSQGCAPQPLSLAIAGGVGLMGSIAIWVLPKCRAVGGALYTASTASAWKAAADLQNLCFYVACVLSTTSCVAFMLSGKKSKSPNPR
jgi:hypothetical protein